MKYRPRHVAEYVVLRVIGFLMARLPYRLALLIGWLAGAFSFFIVRYRVTEACRRIKQVFPDRFTDREIRKVAWHSWRSFSFNVVDMFRLHLIDQKWIDRHVVDFAPARDMIQAHCRTGQGAIIASGHMGAAEVSSVLMQQSEVPIFLITGKQKNPLVDKYLFVMRGRTGIPTVQRGSKLLKSVIRQLKEGGVLAFLADLRVSPNGTLVHFLGHTASVAPGMAKFAKQTGVPILPMVIRRIGWTHHQAFFTEPVLPDPKVAKIEDCARMTQEVFDVIDRTVQETPEQWFWFNKRWILDPPTDETPTR